MATFREISELLTGNTETLISVSYNSGTDKIDFVVAEASINHDNLTGFVANEHIDWTSTSSNLSTSGTAATGALTVTGNISVTGTVDGRDLATDGTKLDGIEALADVTDEANVKAALDGATLTAATLAANDKILIQDTDGLDVLKTVTAQAIADLTPTLTQEEVQDYVGAMIAGNTETGITVTYEDVDGTLDFVVSDTTVAGDSGSTGITPGDTLTIAGGTNCTTAMSGDTLTVNVDDAFLLNNGDVGTGVYDFGGATSFEIPNSAAPSLTVAGQIALDTTITDLEPALKYHDGTSEYTVVAVKTANLNFTDNYIIDYDAATNTFLMSENIGGSGIANIVEDLTPQLGGQLDVNGQALGDGTLEILKFGETASAVNEITITNAATAGSPSITATGDDENIDLTLDGKGSGTVKTLSSNLDITGNIIVSGTVDGRDLATDGTKLDGIEALADVTDEANVTDALDGATLTAATLAANDKVLIQDTDGSDVLKTVTAQAIADLGGGGNWVHISTATASTSASLSFTGLSSSYIMYVLVLNSITPQTDNQTFEFLTSTDNGSTYDNSANNYWRASWSTDSDDASVAVSNSKTLSACGVSAGISNTENLGGLSGVIRIMNPSLAEYCKITYEIEHYRASVAQLFKTNGTFFRAASADVDAIKFQMASGNILSGTIDLYGVSNA